jgi:hypothetical protein
VRRVVELLDAAGVPLEQVRAATVPQRWIRVTPAQGENVEAAFHREQPSHGNRYRVDPGLIEGGHDYLQWLGIDCLWLPRSTPRHCAWVMPPLGGRRTEKFLANLARAPDGKLDWQAGHQCGGAGDGTPAAASDGTAVLDGTTAPGTPTAHVHDVAAAPSSDAPRSPS